MHDFILVCLGGFLTFAGSAFGIILTNRLQEKRTRRAERVQFFKEIAKELVVPTGQVTGYFAHQKYGRDMENEDYLILHQALGRIAVLAYLLNDSNATEIMNKYRNYFIPDPSDESKREFEDIINNIQSVVLDLVNRIPELMVE